jgi:hypothetical protein
MLKSALLTLSAFGAAGIPLVDVWPEDAGKSAGVEMDYIPQNEMNFVDINMDALLDAPVVGLTDAKIGHVSEVLVNEDLDISGLVVSQFRLLALSSESQAVPSDNYRVQQLPNGTLIVHLVD